MKKVIGAAVTALTVWAFPASAQEQEPRGQGGQMTTIAQQELDQLHRRLIELERQNTRLQAEVETLRRQSGVGGGGESGAAEAGTGEAGTGGAGTGTAAPAPETRGRAVVTATFEGTVQAVTPQRISVLDEEGLRYDLVIDEQTHAIRNGRPFPLDQISEGTPVRATFDLISGNDHATRIEVLPE